MDEPTTVLHVQRCPDCHGTFLPRVAPCPRCGALALRRGTIQASGVVVAATELWAPPEGWTAPHRLVLVECAELVRVLAWTSKELPAVGSPVEVIEEDGEAYQVRALNGPPRSLPKG